MDKNSYALGMSIAHNMLQSGVKEVSFDDFVAGLKATLTRTEPAISYEEASELWTSISSSFRRNRLRNRLK